MIGSENTETVNFVEKGNTLLPTEQGVLAERIPQPYNVVCAYRPNLAGIHFSRSELFCWIKALSPRSCHFGYSRVQNEVPLFFIGRTGRAQH